MDWGYFIIGRLDEIETTVPAANVFSKKYPWTIRFAHPNV